MEEIKLEYSDKNIPIPADDEVRKVLLEQTKKVLNNLRWRAEFHLNPEKRPKNGIEYYGFRSNNDAPVVKELQDFEKGMLDLIQGVEFNKRGSGANSFQKKLSRDLKVIREDNRVSIHADKGDSYYQIDKDGYNNLVDSQVQGLYKKAPARTQNKVNMKDKNIATNLNLEDRMEVPPRSEAFGTIKDHKPSFPNKVDVRLINPNKTEVGIVSRQILQRVLKEARNKVGVNLWTSTAQTIKWFNSIDNKSDKRFIVWDIKEYYPSIKKELLNEALQFMKGNSSLKDEEIEIIMAARTTLLYREELEWQKRGGNGLFDVTQGAFDGAEVSECIGLLMLSKATQVLKEIGLYRDDGLGVTDKSPKEAERIKKAMCALFRDHGLKLEIETNKTTVDFLDVKFDLATGEYMPFKKENNVIKYINIQSNHPKSVMDSVPKGVNHRLNVLCSSEKIFNECIEPYQTALRVSGFKQKLFWDPNINCDTTSVNRNKRKRKISWFNPPFSKSIKTPIGKLTLQLLDKCFPKGHTLHKILNRNTFKVSFKAMPNVRKIISGSNMSKLKPDNSKSMDCNCQKSRVCPLGGSGCRKSEVIYKAEVKSSMGTKTYTGLSSTPIKERISNHYTTFGNNEKRSNTSLAGYIWDLKDDGLAYEVTWEILAEARAYKPGNWACRLCLTEKFYIIYRKDSAQINKRSEFFGKCRHREKFKYRKVK